MIITRKIKHGANLKDELNKARFVAQWAIDHRDTHMLSSRHVKHIGLKSAIANQVLRKYGNDKKCKKITKVKLAVPNQGIGFDREKKIITAKPLKLDLHCWFDLDAITKINQIEFDEKWAYVSLTIEAPKPLDAKRWIGVDLNAVSHCVVAADPETGKVIKLGRSIGHTKRKGRDMRAVAQRKQDFRLAKRLGRRERNKTKDELRKATKALVDEAKKSHKGIRFEELKQIRRRITKPHRKRANFTVNSWPFWQFQQLLETCAKLHGVPVQRVNPAFTSQRCSCCGHTEQENRNAKCFKCLSCGHVDHADANAAFNIAFASSGVIDRSSKETRSRGVLDSPGAMRENVTEP